MAPMTVSDRLARFNRRVPNGETLGLDVSGEARDGEGPLIAWCRDPAGNILSIVEQG
jgi:hypothetical protein